MFLFINLTEITTYRQKKKTPGTCNEYDEIRHFYQCIQSLILRCFIYHQFLKCIPITMITSISLTIKTTLDNKSIKFLHTLCSL